MANHENQDIVAECASAFNPQTRTRRGICPVTWTRHQPQRIRGHSLYFEVHGSGPQKIVLIMGMTHCCFAWLQQVDYFGKLEQYTTLAFDNRGIGMSDSSPGFYSTSEMAEDTLCLLDHLQWTEDRSLHVVGASMGGMIAQELAYRIPERIISLSLVVTRPGGSVWTHLPPPLFLIIFLRYFSLSDQMQRFQLQMVGFPSEWMDSLAENDPEGRTNREVQTEILLRRAAAVKPQTFLGGIGQLVASITHNMSPERLARISASIPKVLIISGADDWLMPPKEGEKLKRCMPEAEYQCWEKIGHGLTVQGKERFHQALERVFEQGREAAGRAY